MKLWSKVVLEWARWLSAFCAVQVWGAAADSIVEDPLTLESPVPPQIVHVIPEPSSKVRELYSIEVGFSQPVLGVDAMDLLIGGVSATNVEAVTPEQFVFTFSAPLPGPLLITWRADHGILDAATSTQLFSGEGWSYELDPTLPASGLIISEFMTENEITLKDEDGDTPDWIEIYNQTDEPADLEGWFLTDNPLELTQWRFPAVSLPPKTYLVVFASEKNKTNVNGRLHTNFKLANEGEYLALVNNQTNVISEFAPQYCSQVADVSYGRLESDPRIICYFSKPTPGHPNSTSGSGFAPSVHFSHTSRAFRASFTLALSCADAGAVIRYTLDGNIPTEASLVYTQPLPMTNSALVRARAFSQGLVPGPVRGEAFVMLSSSLAEFRSDLPVLVFDNFGRGSISSTRSSYAHLLLYEPIAGQTSFDQPPHVASRAALQIRGSSTSGYAKASYKLELWDESGVDADLPLLGMPPESDWILYAPNNFEPALIHNPFVHQLSRDLGQYSPRTRFVEVYVAKSAGSVTTNHYNGIYVLEERIKIDPSRVAIDRLQPEDTAPPAVTGGYLLKIDRLDPGDSGLRAGGASICFVDPKERELKTKQRLPQRMFVSNYFNAFSKALNASNWRDPSQGYRAYIDVPNWIDYHVLEVLSGNVDALVLSAYFHKPRLGKIQFGPHWDFDRALGSTDGRDYNPRNWNTGPFFSAVWWSRLFSDKDFWQLWVDRWQEFRGRWFSASHINGLIDRLALEVRQAQPREQRRWRIAPRGGSYQAEVDRMKNWLSNRIDFIDRQLAQPPVFSLPNDSVMAGAWLKLSAPSNGFVYFTTDGSDPRGSQGAVASRAIRYSGPIQINSNVRITARTYDANKRQTGGPPAASSTPWSAPVSRVFLVSRLPLLITEIMFHPEPQAAGSSGPACEFVEIMNTGLDAITLAGVRLAGDIECSFAESPDSPLLASGGRVVVVNSVEAFRKRYGETPRIAGEFSASLSRSGGRLTLLGPWSEQICEVEYQDSWAVMSDGFGFSLTLDDETTPPGRLSEGARWRASGRVGGSPGAPDPGPTITVQVFINEIIANPAPGQKDTIELFNAENKMVDVSGWWLTDDFRTPKKAQLPPGSLITPRGTAVFTAELFNVFGLSQFGDEAYLFSAEPSGELTGWYHGCRFGPQAPGTSCQRWITRDNFEHWIHFQNPSLGQTNPPPIAGPVVISEIMYAPPPFYGTNLLRGEFVELADISHGIEPFRLGDSAQPESVWRLRGAIEFDFQAGFQFPSNRFIVIVGFDPELNPEVLAEFRARYWLDESVKILGPWRGTLPDQGGQIELLAPFSINSSNEADPSGSIPMESMNYLSAAPWPIEAGGTGNAIARLALSSFGGEAAFWNAQTPSPGDLDSDGDTLPDRWELSNGLDPLDASRGQGSGGDLDGDGFANGHEYQAGTRADDPSSLLELQVRALAGGQIELYFVGGPGRGYSILARPDLAQETSQLVGHVYAPPSGGLLNYRVSMTNNARFYQLSCDGLLMQ